MDIFHQKIRQSIADENLQKALDGNAEKRVQGRAAALASLPDWQERRQRAHTVRADVIRCLDEYLHRFIKKAQENGVIVHRAVDAAEAVKIVLGIAGAVAQEKNKASLLFAKSKSMVSEEIGLNHALEAAGHRVVETDLGEYIIQLRGERPSHIIAPAIHLRRGQVGELFADKLGIPYTEDIPTLTNTARRVLRDVFLTADVGVSGVNFGVAATGTMTIVTNEGNGRMVTTLPRVHIALMGMERLLPTLDDLSLLLSLLPRSATGQKLSVYTHLIQRPEPGQVRHVVIVDNGRSSLRNSPLAESLYCIRCGACLNACPVFREIGGHAYRGGDGSIAPYPGPIGSVISPGLMGENFTQLAQASSLCGACKDACPVAIDLPKMLLRVRAGQSAPEPRPDGSGLPGVVRSALSAYSRVSSSPGLFSVSQQLAGWMLAPLPADIPVPAASGWGYSKDMPKPAAKPFRARMSTLDQQVSTLVAPVPADAEAPGQPNAQQPPLLEQFSAELAALNGQSRLVAREELPEKLLEFLHARNIDRIQAWETIPGLDFASLAEAGIRVEHAYDGSIRAGLSGALAGIADTGTLVIPGGEGRPLTASLVPELHIAVLERSALVGSLDEALRLPGITDAPATALVTGPSRTADIEMTLTLGVHGPGELHVFIVDA